MTRVRSSHHVFGIEHLLCQFGHCHGAVLLAAAGSEGSEAGHEEMETRERNYAFDQSTVIGRYSQHTHVDG